MNLIQFLNKVDEIADSGSKDELFSFIHETARLLEEESREEFIVRLEKAVAGRLLEGIRKEYSANGQGAVSGGGLAEEELEEYHRISKELDQIENRELLIQEEYNEEYDDWYSMADEFLYHDPQGIGEILGNACQFVHKCVDRCAYQEGSEIGERLFFLRVPVDSDYGSDDFSLSDMSIAGLLEVTLKNVALDSLYCIYHAYPLEERPVMIYDLFWNAEIRELGLEDLLVHGSEELEDIDEFLDLWISYLKDKPDRMANQLFLEAISLKGDMDFAIEAARTSAKTHPELYLRLLDQELPSSAKVELGLEALQLMDPAEADIRSRIALRTADYAVDEGRPDEAEMCRLESFRSIPAPIHYLRALLNARDKSMVRTQLEGIWEQANQSAGSAFYALEFLRGNFAKVLSDQRGMGMRESLGWSGCFMKQGFALFCLYLYEGGYLPAGIRRMEEIASDALDFTWTDYSKGLGTKERENHEEEKEEFYPYFLKWKALTPMERTDIAHALRRLEQMVELRVKGIMDANKRNYYGECAAFIAALGEVKESRGEEGGKQRLMSYYQERYSRRWAFRNELRDFGLWT